MILLTQHPPKCDPNQAWIELERRSETATRLFRLLALRRRSPHADVEHTFTRLECPEWVNVIAFRAPDIGGELLAVEQFRHGVDAATFEIIGGVSDPGEDSRETAVRELREETGHVATTLISLGSCTPNPAVQNNRCHFFLALGCRPDGPLRLDAAEELRVWGVPWREWEEMIRSGKVHHALVLAAWLKLQTWEGWHHLKQTLD